MSDGSSQAFSLQNLAIHLYQRSQPHRPHPIVSASAIAIFACRLRNAGRLSVLGSPDNNARILLGALLKVDRQSSGC